jgi:hypothetical protein
LLVFHLKPAIPSKDLLWFALPLEFSLRPLSYHPPIRLLLLFFDYYQKIRDGIRKIPLMSDRKMTILA